MTTAAAGDAVAEFDVCGPLPQGVTVLEASAGTGKTYTIAALAARYVADGIPLERLLLVTFTRLATGELRERVRRRLVATEQALARALAGGPPDDDEVSRLLATGPGDVVGARHARLAAALADFDAGTIATTHGFCQEVLAGLGIAGDAERDLTFVEDVSELLEQVVDDLYVRKWHAAAGAPAFDRAQALAIARAAVEHPDAALVPVDAPDWSVEAVRVSFARAVRTELAARKARLGLLTYDDLLTRLQATFDRAGGDVAAARLRSRYDVVLVDEFQDTDPIQWEILCRAFMAAGVTLVLIGDPKQAIYAFRGADVYAYLRAARAAGTRRTLAVNWRSDQGLIDAHDALFGGAQLGHPGIGYRTVRATAANQRARLHGAPVDAPLRIRVVSRDEPRVGQTRRGFATAPGAHGHVALDLAQDVVRLLGSAATVDGEPVEPRHVAVLVRTNKVAAQVRDALAQAGVPAVLAGAGSVFGTPAADAWRRLLEALERPASAARARSAALTPFVGWSTERVALAGEGEWELVHRRLHRWARVLRRQGVAVLVETLTSEEGLPGRVLAHRGGERTLTDLRHVGQLLHEAAVRGHLGTTALAGWLRERIAAAAQEGEEERARRLESDADAVQVLTIHGAKGLEYPIVYLPDLWRRAYVPEGELPVTFHDPDDGDLRKLDVGLGETAAYRAHRRRQEEEQRGEDLRLLYVALTRARHQAIVWWAGSYDSRDAALCRLAFERGEDGSVPTNGSVTPTDADATERFRALAARAPGCVTVEASALVWPSPTWTPAGAQQPSALASARFDRALDGGWRRTSFSDLTAGTSHEPRVASEPERPVLADEPAEPQPAPVAAAGRTPASPQLVLPGAAPDEAALRAVASPWADVPGGVGVGTLVHEVLEEADFASPALADDLRSLVAAARRRRPLEVGDADVLVAGLLAAIDTPWGPVFGDLRLRDVARADRLDELGFELPLAGGDVPCGGSLTPERIAAVLREHLPAGDPLAGYADRLDDPGLRSGVRGYLAGFIDVVVRVAGPDGPRFVIVDHKTNRLGGHDLELTAWHYRPEALAAEMERSHYALQGLLYAAALHRYLRWRLPGYDPERALGGIAYLFLRGMTGAATPRVDGVPCGVFAWRPPAALIVALSDLLAK